MILSRVLIRSTLNTRIQPYKVSIDLELQRAAMLQATGPSSLLTPKAIRCRRMPLCIRMTKQAAISPRSTSPTSRDLAVLRCLPGPITLKTIEQARLIRRALHFLQPQRGRQERMAIAFDHYKTLLAPNYDPSIIYLPYRSAHRDVLAFPVWRGKIEIGFRARDHL